VPRPGVKMRIATPDGVRTADEGGDATSAGGGMGPPVDGSGAMNKRSAATQGFIKNGSVAGNGARY
jgi:hypothetical protein